MNNETGQEKLISTWVKAIQAITLIVDDLETTSQFYQRVFGLLVVFHDDDSTVFRFGDVLVNLLRYQAADELIRPATVGKMGDSSRFVFTIHVEDVDAMCIELAKRGVKLLNGPQDRPWGPRTASFIDPGGYIWEIAS